MKLYPLFLTVIFLFFSCNEKNSFLLSFEYEEVLRSTNPKTGILEVKNQIPQDFPKHKDYMKYGETKIYYLPSKLKFHIEKFKDSTIIIFDKNRSGCLKFEGFTKLQNDTLFLNFQSLNNACKEEEIYRFKYVIQNSEDYSFIEF